jgi:hypothetical protein
MKASIVTSALVALVGAAGLLAGSQEPKQEERSGRPDPLTVTTPLESKPSKHVVNANKVRECIGATYTQWTEDESAPKQPTTLLTAVSCCARENGTEAFQDYVSIHGSGLETLLKLVERQREAERGEPL